MHFKILVAVEAPTAADDFSWQVKEGVMEVMEPYWEATEDRKYLEFVDCTEKLKCEFAQNLDCLRLADGRIVELGRYPYYNHYTIRNGKVYQKEAGPLRHEKCTKAAKRITALPDYPRARLYKSFEDYVESYWGFSYDTEHNGYGYYCNPNGRWDWYEIGGRWPDMFLVKDTCMEYYGGEYSWCVKETVIEAPKGFRWVAAARKKDIEWQAMRDWENEKTKEYFYNLEKMFLSGALAENFSGEITEDGIIRWGELIYRKGESVEAYLKRMGIQQDRRYPLIVNSIVETGRWFDRESFLCWNCLTGKLEPEEWWAFLEKYIDELADDMVLAGVDYHM